MKRIDGYFVDCGDESIVTVVHTSKSLTLGPGNYTVIIDNILDISVTIKVPKPELAMGCIYSIVVMANPSTAGGSTEADVTIIDGNGVSHTSIEEWGESTVLWSDGFYFHNIQTILVI